MLLRSVAAVLACTTAAPVPAAPPQTRPSAARSPGDSGQAGRIERALLRAEQDDGLLDAVRLRLPHVQWAAFGDTATAMAPDPDPEVAPAVAPEGLVAVLSLDEVQPDAIQLTIVVSDGRAFDRRIDVRDTADAERTRLLAGNVANLIAGIEAGTVVADRSDVPLPVPDPVPAPTCPATPACPDPPVTALRQGGTAPRPQARTEVAVTGGLPVVLGVGQPVDADRFAAWGGELGMQLRLRRGATFAADVRPAGRSTVGGVRIVRSRVAVGAGVTWRRGSFELSALGFAAVEPWIVRVEGQAATFVAGSASRRLLIGGGVRVAPGLRWTPPKQRSAKHPLAFRASPYAELSMSGSPADGFAVPRIVLPSEEASRIRLGGLEAVLGVQLVAWFSVGRPRS